MNYTGSKFKLLLQILPYFPNDINTFRKWFEEEYIMIKRIIGEDQYVVVYFGDLSFQDMTLCTKEEFYNDLYNGLYQHDRYIAEGFVTKEDAEKFLDELKAEI